MIKRTTLANWLKRNMTLTYFDGRCEAESLERVSDTKLRLGMLRCQNNAVDENGGFAVCWRHRAPQQIFVDPVAQSFREHA